MTDTHSPASKRFIIFVDDTPDLVDIVRILLEENGFNVRCAYSGQELFAGLEEQKPDLILLDIMMPQNNGLEVLTLLKENSETRSIPVILVTAMVRYENIIRGYRMEADYYITKPFTEIQLLTGINLLLSRPDPPLFHPRASA